MPYCPISPPPTPAVALPWQAPFELLWFAFALALVLIVAIGRQALRRLGQDTPPERVRTRRVLVVAVCVLNVVVFFILLMVLWAEEYRLTAWVHTEVHRFDDTCNNLNVYAAVAAQERVEQNLLHWLVFPLEGISFVLLGFSYGLRRRQTPLNRTRIRDA